MTAPTAAAPNLISGPLCCTDRKGIQGYGAKDAKVMLVGIAPGQDEWKRTRRPFTGPSGRLGDGILKAGGWLRDDCYATNLCCFWRDEPTQEEIAGCWPRLKAEIQMIQPRLIVALGALACEWLTGYKVGKVRGGFIYPRDNKSPNFWELNAPSQVVHLVGGVSASELEGLLNTVNGSSSVPPIIVPSLPSAVVTPVTLDVSLPVVLPTWHPAAALRVPALATDILRDFKKIPHFIEGRLNPPNWTYHVVRDKREAQEALYWFSGRVVSLDVETASDREDDFDHVVCFALGTKVEGHYVSYVFPREIFSEADLSRAGWGLDWPRNIEWGYQNSPFDRQALRRSLDELRLPVSWDSMLTSIAADERPGYDRDTGSQGRNKSAGPGFHSLKQLGREYGGAPMWEDEVKGIVGKDLDLQFEEERKPRTYTEELLDEASGMTVGVTHEETSEEALARASAWLASCKERLYKYNAYDTVQTLVVQERVPMVAGEDFAGEAVERLMLPAFRAFTEIQYRGTPVDEKRLEQLISQWDEDVSGMEAALVRQAVATGFRQPPTKGGKKARAAWELGEVEGEPFNPSSRPQLARLLFGDKVGTNTGPGWTLDGSRYRGLGLRSKHRTPSGRQSTKEDFLKELDHPFIRDHLQHSKYEHILAFARGIKSDIRADGKVHPSFMWLATGRNSLVDPALQTIPNEDEDFPELGVIKEIFVARPGYVIAGADYAQIELWVAAYLSGDPVMLADLQDPRTMHTIVAREILGCDAPEGSVEFARRRLIAKKYNFSVMYLTGAETLSLVTKLGLVEAQEHIRGWFKRYRVLHQWLMEHIRQVKRDGVYVSPFGWKRRFPYIPSGEKAGAFDRQIANVPIQHVAAMHGLTSLIELEDWHLAEDLPFYDELPRVYKKARAEQGPMGIYDLRDVDGRVLLSNHDAIYCEIPSEMRDLARYHHGLRLIRDVMESPKLPDWPGMKVEIKIGPNFHDLHRVEI